MTGINWSGFSWEAFATIVVGVPAVLGAVWVGLRQAKLAARQTAILEEQARLSDLTLRANLFERRMKVYAAIHEYLRAIVVDKAIPLDQREFDFHDAVESSEFLFSPIVYDRILEILKATLTFRWFPKDEDMLEDIDTHLKRKHELSMFFHTTLNSLPKTFGDSLRLGG